MKFKKEELGQNPLQGVWDAVKQITPEQVWELTKVTVGLAGATAMAYYGAKYMGGYAMDTVAGVKHVIEIPPVLVNTAYAVADNLTAMVDTSNLPNVRPALESIQAFSEKMNVIKPHIDSKIARDSVQFTVEQYGLALEYGLAGMVGGAFSGFGLGYASMQTVEAIAKHIRDKKQERVSNSIEIASIEKGKDKEQSKEASKEDLAKVQYKAREELLHDTAVQRVLRDDFLILTSDRFYGQKDKYTGEYFRLLESFKKDECNYYVSLMPKENNCILYDKMVDAYVLEKSGLVLDIIRLNKETKEASHVQVTVPEIYEGEEPTKEYKESAKLLDEYLSIYEKGNIPEKLKHLDLVHVNIPHEDFDKYCSYNNENEILTIKHPDNDKELVVSAPLVMEEEDVFDILVSSNGQSPSVIRDEIYSALSPKVQEVEKEESKVTVSREEQLQNFYKNQAKYYEKQLEDLESMER